MIVAKRKLLDFFLWFQTGSLLTESYQSGVFDLLVTCVNAAFVIIFLVHGTQTIQKAALPVVATSLLIMLQLLLPASVSLISAQSGLLFGELVKLTAWLAILMFAINVHEDRDAIQATFRTLHRCALALLMAIVIFQITGWGETAYDLGVLHLGGIKNEPSVSMFALAFLSTLFVKMDRRQQFLTIIGMLLVILFLMKRSSLVAGVLLLLIGSKYLLPVGRGFRVFLWIGSLFVAINIAISFDLAGMVDGSSFLSARFKDIEKLQQTQDFGYLGSGRLGLLHDHLAAFSARDPLQRLLGLMVTNPIEIAAGGYLGQGLHAAAHNDFMEILTRGGILGLISYIVLLTVIGKNLLLVRTHPTDLFLASVLFAGKMAALAYVLHIFIGVVFKVQFMAVIAIAVGIALRVSCDAQRAPNLASQ